MIELDWSELDRKWHRPMQEVCHDYMQQLKGGSKQPKHRLPIEFSRKQLRHFRSLACKHNSQQLMPSSKSVTPAGCPKWTQEPPAWHADLLYDEDSPSGPYLLVHEYVCTGCKRKQRVKIDAFITQLGLDVEKDGFDARTLQRYLACDEGEGQVRAIAMRPVQMRYAAAGAFIQGWLDVGQYMSIILEVDRLEVVSRGLRALSARVSERKERSFSMQEVEREFEKQSRLLDHANKAIIDKISKESPDPMLRALAIELLAES